MLKFANKYKWVFIKTLLVIVIILEIIITVSHSKERDKLPNIEFENNVVYNFSPSTQTITILYTKLPIITSNNKLVNVASNNVLKFKYLDDYNIAVSNIVKTNKLIKAVLIVQLKKYNYEELTNMDNTVTSNVDRIVKEQLLQIFKSTKITTNTDTVYLGNYWLNQLNAK